MIFKALSATPLIIAVFIADTVVPPLTALPNCAAAAVLADAGPGARCKSLENADVIFPLK